MAPPKGTMLGWTISEWKSAYRQGTISPENLLSWVTSWDPKDPAWIELASEAQLAAQFETLEENVRRAGGDREKFPLYGVPFAVKDNIDVASFRTTAACPAFSFEPASSAFGVARLQEKGAIVVGKTNLDQFATGLVGVRSPYGIVPSVFDSKRIGGGSSSGSASVVARGLVPFSFGTDTAGSGRVPAAFQNIVGLKPTRGRISSTGLIPACRTLDCVSVFALTTADARFVFEHAEAHDASDPYSRAKVQKRRRSRSGLFALPRTPEFFGDELARASFHEAIALLEENGAKFEEIDFEPFRALALLLYQGPWVAERTVVVERLLAEAPEAVHPTVRSIIESGRKFSALDAFRAEYERARLAREIARLLEPFEALVLPTTPTSYTIEEVLADPIGANSRLGTFTNFANLADLSAISVPGPLRKDGFPAGVTFFGPAFADEELLDIAEEFQTKTGLELGKTGRYLPAPGLARAANSSELHLAVVGAHLSGLPLNRELTDLGARLVEKTATTPRYRLFALPNTTPPKPGLVRFHEGTSIEVEVWSVPLENIGHFLAKVRHPLGLGQVELFDGTWVHGFVCEPVATEGAEDISGYGGFRHYLARDEKESGKES